MDKLPNLNDEDLEKILHPNNLFGEELRPLEKDTSSGAIEDIVNPSLDSQGYNRNEVNNTTSQPGTHLVHRMAPLEIYQGASHPNSSNQLLPFRSTVQQQTHQQQQQQPPPSTRNSKTRPAFVNKVWSMLNDESNVNLIKWSDDGNSFIVVNREEFVHEILPKYFKHSNFASFVRQLNMYGWHKVQDVKSGSIQNSSDDKWQFENDYFIRGREDLLEKIVRQKSSTTNSKLNGQNNGSFNGSDLNLMGELNLGDSVNVSALLGELEQIKYNQMAISKDLLRINKDNEMLWKENMMARERHRTQQQALEKILRFLASLVPHMDQKMITEGIMNNNSGTGATGNHNSHNNNAENINELHTNNFEDDFSNINMNVPIDGTQAYANNAYGLNETMKMDQRGKSRFLLKNRTNSMASSNGSRTRYNSNDGRISEIPFDEDEDTNNDNKSNYTVGLRDQNSNYNSSFFNNLQTNIDEQDERIQHLEDIVQGLSPSDSNYSKTHHSNSNNNSKEANPNGNPSTNFDLQDYCFSNVNSPSSESRTAKFHTPGGLSPLMGTDNEDLISIGDNSPNMLMSDIPAVKSQGTQDAKIPIEETSEINKRPIIEEINNPTAKRAKH